MIPHKTFFGRLAYKFPKERYFGKNDNILFFAKLRFI